MIDFSKAPEGATHYYIIEGENIIEWYKKTVLHWCFYQGGIWFKLDSHDESKTIEIPNQEKIGIESMDDKRLIQELKDEIKQLKCQLEVERLVNELDGMDAREIANHIVYKLGFHRNFN